MDTQPTEKMKCIEVAEIRATVLNQTSSFPMRVMGLRRNDYFFPYLDKTGKMTRRYRADCEAADPDRGIYPIAQAAEEMDDIQHRGDRIVIVWQIIDRAQAEAEAAAEAERLRGIEEGVKERQRLLKIEEDAAAAAAKQLGESNAKIGLLSEPGMVVAPAKAEETAEGAEEKKEPAKPEPKKKAAAKGTKPAALANLEAAAKK